MSEQADVRMAGLPERLEHGLVSFLGRDSTLTRENLEYPRDL